MYTTDAADEAAVDEAAAEGVDPFTERDDDDNESSTSSSESTAEPNENEKKEHQELPKRRKRKKPPEYYNENLWERPSQRGYKGPQVNWTTLSGRQWAKDSLLKYMPHPEIANLIHWAHHRKPLFSTSVAYQEQSFTTNEMEPNPLIEVDRDSPLPMSQIHFLQGKARELIVIKGEKPEDEKVVDESMRCLLESFDTSAAVAMGMALEEMITANLLPLAEAHVRRCRWLEENNSQSPSNEESSPFQEWTLPPEEAIFNAMVSSLPAGASPQDNGKGMGSLPSACPPNRTLLTQQDDDSNRDHKQLAADSFCQRQVLATQFVQRNMDIYKWFLASAPENDDGEGLKKITCRRGKRKDNVEDVASTSAVKTDKS